MGRVKEFYACPVCAFVGADCICFPEPEQEPTCTACYASEGGICGACREVAEREEALARAIELLRAHGFDVKEITA
jgi:hypothetical protein